MTLDQLRYALALQTHGNFSRAAEACHITQPSLSVQIAKLEEELGLPLFHRTRSGVEVTEYGEELLRQARVALDEATRLGELARELKGEVRGRFRLGVIPTLAPTVLPDFLGGFGRKYPQVELAVSEDTTGRLVQEIAGGTIDGALLSTPARCPDSLLERVLFYEPFVLYASNGHPILEHKRLLPEHISSREVLLLDDAHCLRDQALQICKARAVTGGTGEAPRLRIRSGSLQTLIEVLRREPGYTLLPALSLRFLSAAERTRNVRTFARPVPARKISLVFHKTRLKRSLVEALREQLLAHVPPEALLQFATGEIRVLSPGPEHFEA